VPPPQRVLASHVEAVIVCRVRRKENPDLEKMLVIRSLVAAAQKVDKLRFQGMTPTQYIYGNRRASTMFGAFKKVISDSEKRHATAITELANTIDRLQRNQAAAAD